MLDAEQELIPEDFVNQLVKARTEVQKHGVPATVLFIPAKYKNDFARLAAVTNDLTMDDDIPARWEPLISWMDPLGDEWKILNAKVYFAPVDEPIAGTPAGKLVPDMGKGPPIRET